LRKGIIEIPFGESLLKSQTIRSGIVPLRQYQPALKELIESGSAKPSFVVDKELRIEDVPEAYQGFSDHDFIKSVICFDDGKNGSLIDEEESEEKAPTRNVSGQGHLKGKIPAPKEASPSLWLLIYTSTSIQINSQTLIILRIDKDIFSYRTLL
jgi:hypothetical protein